MNKEDALTAERLREVLNFDPQTGVFTRRTKTTRSPVGEVVGSMHHKGYLRMSVDGRIYWAHRLAWLHEKGEWPNGALDHINRIRTDNRIANLREASSAENNCNVTIPKTNTSGVKGVSWNEECRKWRVKVVMNRKPYYGGMFSCIEDANQVVTALRAKLHGAFSTDGLPQANSQEGAK